MIVAPTWLLMSSPMIGSPASAKRARHPFCEAMNTGTQFTKAQPASSARSAYQRVASSLPTGR